MIAIGKLLLLYHLLYNAIIVYRVFTMLCVSPSLGLVTCDRGARAGFADNASVEFTVTG